VYEKLAASGGFAPNPNQVRLTALTWTPWSSAPRPDP